jgi:hypothetical protein
MQELMRSDSVSVIYKIIMSLGLMITVEIIYDRGHGYTVTRPTFFEGLNWQVEGGPFTRWDLGSELDRAQES